MTAEDRCSKATTEETLKRERKSRFGGFSFGGIIFDRAADLRRGPGVVVRPHASRPSKVLKPMVRSTPKTR
jgi:hypothetical protein